MPIDYMNPGLANNLDRTVIPVVDATAESLAGYGVLVDDPNQAEVEIVRWPAQGWRPVDLDSGDEAGTTEGTFLSSWKGDILYGSNAAVGGEYVLGYSIEPGRAQTDHSRIPERVLMWHANYHPDGGQLFFPLDNQTYYLPLALPGDDISPSDFTCFRLRGDQGCCIHPNVWHEGVFAQSGQQRFFDRQGRVHARVSVDFAREFSCLVEFPTL
ncbi:ureidoglycolate lyase [Aureliella helgolandensis]|uniref:Ureidoglycolate hydrolase n=1 Tax=Aureliella helgolandensis TaxID=2527968 RepID=A0A518GGT3_9BACT|nr:ureidoglycolate lyase [Aureliella helgolandensis]QDV27806.1 ureidoglycolate hydrolase [Aureliella helgolandensis]